MATKLSKLNALSGLHTAGIFSDMTVDGPEIGTLVVIVDRAKNLPNRKTIGKQDPYCAARLGKEAKKTETDRRGGQTPRWDQELRYTVHDSPDYYQLKVSVFNDDKKTELIGETWVDLKEVVVPGGGQNDLWHNLNCKGKYAGEIRIEITYYDSRPKQEKPEVAKQAATNRVDEGGRDSLKGPRQPKTAVKRRPLPSDPVTGTPATVAVPDHVQTPPRGYPPSPTVVPDHGQTPPRAYQYPPSSIPEHVQTPPRGYQQSSPAQEYGPTPSRGYQQSSPAQEYGPTPSRGFQQPNAEPEHRQTPPRGYQPPTAPDHIQTPSRGYQNQPSAIPDHVQTPQRGHQNSNYISNQSPLQSVEYNTGLQEFSPAQGYDNNPQMNGYGPPPGGMAAASPAQPISNDRYEVYDPAPQNDYAQGNSLVRYGDQSNGNFARDRYNSQQNSYDPLYSDEFRSPPSPGGPPPPPPAHRTTRSGNGSAHASPGQGRNSFGGSYGFPPTSQAPEAYSTPPRDIHRKSIPSYAQSNSYQAYSPDKDPDQFRRSMNEGYDPSPPQHQSYDSKYNGDYGSMQATVEDVPESPRGGYSSHRGSVVSRHSAYDKVPSPAPLNLSGRGSSGSGRNSMSNTPNPQYSSSSNGYATSNSQGSGRDRSHTDASVSSRTSYNSLPQQQDQRSRGQSQGQSQGQASGSVSYAPPPVPATLVPGIDPLIAQEISDRMYEEKWASYSRGMGNQLRGRYDIPTQYQPDQQKQLTYPETSAMVPFVPASARQDDRQNRYSGDDQQIRYSGDDRQCRYSGDDQQSRYSGDDQQSRYSSSVHDRQNSYSTAIVPFGKPRDVSPDTRLSARKSVSPDTRLTARKSVSPDTRLSARKSVSPSPGATDDRRRLSGIPFGPDSYNAFNPSVSGSMPPPSLSAAYNPKDADVDAKIITHDGREIDPSDHIPESNYAPLLEKKGPKYASQLPDRNYRPPPNATPPVSSSGRRPLRQAGRPQSMVASSPSYGPPEPVTPTPGRNRLQKKSNRLSAQPVSNSSPLAPITPYQDNSYASRSLARASTMDYNAHENHALSYGNSSGGYRGTAGPPPIPAKVPVNMPQPQAGGGDAWALLEEMKNIDLGSGRARRRGY